MIVGQFDRKRTKMNKMYRISSQISAAMDGLEPWLEKVEAIDELKRISAEVDPDLEMSTITYLSGKTIGGPTLLFENIKGHPGHTARAAEGSRRQESAGQRDH
jgi:3-polyprenyl-4-hydroxybenzoate decarboxylase